MTDRRFDRAGELVARGEVLRVRTLPLRRRSTRVHPGLEGACAPLPDGLQAARGGRAPIAPSAGATGSPSRVPRRPSATRWCTPSTVTSRSTTWVAPPCASSAIPTWIRCSRWRARPPTIERAIRATGIGRDAFTADSLAEFVRRFEARSGRPRAAPPVTMASGSDQLWVVPELGPSLGQLVDPPAAPRGALASRSTTSGSPS